MAIAIKHKFVSAKVDGPDDTLLGPSKWNDEHNILMAAQRLIGRATAGTGAAEEIEIGNGLKLLAGALQIALGAGAEFDENGNLIVSGTPVGCVLDYAGGSAPDGWAFCYGQAVSRTTYSKLFAKIGVTFGAGNGTTTFNLPDIRGRVTAGQDDMGGVSANRMTDAAGGINGDLLGETGGSETKTLTVAQLPAHTHTGTTATGGLHGHPVYISTKDNADSDPDGGFMVDHAAQGQDADVYPAYSGEPGPTIGHQIGGGGAHTHTMNLNNTGSSDPHSVMQPTIVLNKIIYHGVL